MKLHLPAHLRALFLFALLFVAAIGGFANDTNRSTEEGSNVTVKLRYGKEVGLNKTATQTLHTNALQLLKSSNFNSLKHSTASWPQYEISKTQERYRQVVSGKYLLVSFKEPQSVETVGGKVMTKEIIVGLNRPDYADNLFTIDDEGRVGAHDKYSGAVCVKLLEIVKKIEKEAGQPTGF